MATAGAAHQRDQRARPGGGRRHKGVKRRSGSGNPKGGAIWSSEQPRRVPLRFSSFGVFRLKGGIRKGSFQRGKTEGGNGVVGAARRAVRYPSAFCTDWRDTCPAAAQVT